MTHDHDRDLDEAALAELTPERREAYYKRRSRHFENTVRERADYDELAEKARQWEALPKDAQGRPLVTNNPEALATATEQARAQAAASERTRLNAQLVRAEFRAVAPRLSEEVLDGYLEDVDLSRFLTDSGDVDAAKIAARATSLTGGRPGFQGHNR